MPRWLFAVVGNSDRPVCWFAVAAFDARERIATTAGRNGQQAWQAGMGRSDPAVPPRPDGVVQAPVQESAPLTPQTASRQARLARPLQRKREDRRLAADTKPFPDHTNAPASFLLSCFPAFLLVLLFSLPLLAPILVPSHPIPHPPRPPSSSTSRLLTHFSSSRSICIYSVHLWNRPPACHRPLRPVPVLAPLG